MQPSFSHACSVLTICAASHYLFHCSPQLDLCLSPCVSSLNSFSTPHYLCRLSPLVLSLINGSPPLLAFVTCSATACSGSPLVLAPLS
mmetsp:Transcript_52169/g.136384  ORF Transcript_52169/g.136384 Transcript_52169/m.136384 type:complete len:88 (-) Transcript_52169:262-525(-)